jgi:hypothetical protein
MSDLLLMRPKTVLCDPASFSRASTAYLDGVEYPANAPRYLPGGGVMVEEGTANQLQNPLFANFPDGWERSTSTDDVICTYTPENTPYGPGLRVRRERTENNPGTNRWGFIHNLAQYLAQDAVTISLKIKRIGGVTFEANDIDIRNSDHQNDYTGVLACRHITSTGQWIIDGAQYGTGSVRDLDDGWVEVILTRTDWHDYAGQETACFEIYSGTMSAEGHFAEFIIAVPQSERKPYSTSFQDGTRARESLTVPSTGLTPAAGTIEIDVTIDALARRQITGQNPEVFRISGAGSGEIALYHADAAANWVLVSRDDAGDPTSDTIADAAIPDGLRRLRVTWDAAAVHLYVDANAAPVATINAPKLPSAFGAAIALGGRSNTTMLNSSIHGVRISPVNRGAAGLCDASSPLYVDDLTCGSWSFNGNLLGLKNRRY